MRARNLKTCPTKDWDVRQNHSQVRIFTGQCPTFKKLLFRSLLSTFNYFLCLRNIENKALLPVLRYSYHFYFSPYIKKMVVFIFYTIFAAFTIYSFIYLSVYFLVFFLLTKNMYIFLSMAKYNLLIEI